MFYHLRCTLVYKTLVLFAIGCALGLEPFVLAFEIPPFGIFYSYYLSETNIYPYSIILCCAPYSITLSHKARRDTLGLKQLFNRPSNPNTFLYMPPSSIRIEHGTHLWSASELLLFLIY